MKGGAIIFLAWSLLFAINNAVKGVFFMNKFCYIFLILLLISPKFYGGEIEKWRNKNGSKSLLAEYIAHDETHISLRDGKGKKVRIALKNLHAEDLKRLSSYEEAALPEGEEGGGFPTYGLEFGMARDEVIKKMKENPLLESRVSEALLMRGGLSESYQSKALYGGLPVRVGLFFGKNNILREVTLKTPPIEKEDAEEKIADCWDALGLELTELLGEPRSGSDCPDFRKIEDQDITCSHYWVTPEKLHVLLGVGRDMKQYHTIVRITPVPPG